MRRHGRASWWLLCALKKYLRRATWENVCVGRKEHEEQKNNEKEGKQKAEEENEKEDGEDNDDE